jgi:hypothetical protein
LARNWITKGAPSGKLPVTANEAIGVIETDVQVPVAESHRASRSNRNLFH